MNGNTKKELALGAIALGFGVALGAVLGNERTRKSIVETGKNWLNNHRQT
jgi:thiamine biosynthesis lipoprotein ApbE